MPQKATKQRKTAGPPTGSAKTTGGMSVPLNQKLFLTIEEAVGYTGIGQTHLNQLIADGVLWADKIGPHNSSVCNRTELEALADSGKYRVGAPKTRAASR